MHESTYLVALEAAIGRAGTQTKFARLIGVTQQAVSRWVAKRRPIPSEFVLRAEEATGIPRWQLRPDLYPPSEYSDSPGSRPDDAPADVPPTSAGATLHQSSGGRPDGAPADVGGSSAGAREPKGKRS